jgi:hypothetical protein
VEARSMVLGAVAFMICAWVAGRLLIQRRTPVLATTGAAIGLWFVCAFGLWFALIR